MQSPSPIWFTRYRSVPTACARAHSRRSVADQPRKHAGVHGLCTTQDLRSRRLGFDFRVEFYFRFGPCVLTQHTNISITWSTCASYWTPQFSNVVISTTMEYNISNTTKKLDSFLPTKGLYATDYIHLIDASLCSHVCNLQWCKMRDITNGTLWSTKHTHLYTRSHFDALISWYTHLCIHRRSTTNG